MLMRLQRYDLKLVYVPGKDMHISDALSQVYLKETPEILVDDEKDIDSIEAQLPVLNKIATVQKGYRNR
jgi:hypothetical protein